MPNTHQKVLSYGTEFPYVRQTLMTAHRLFHSGTLGPTFDYKRAIDLSFDALQDLAAMHDIHKEWRARFDKITEQLKSLAVQHHALPLPSMGDVRGETKAFLQKADHVAVSLFTIAKLFYGEHGKRWFESLHKLVSAKYGDKHVFTTFMKAVLPFLQFVRNARNAVEHPDQSNSVKVIDISLLPSGELNPPCIEVICSGTPLPPVPLLRLKEHVADQLAAVFETMLAHLCAANVVQSFAGMQLTIMQYDETQQDAYKCRFGYGAQMGDQIVPFG